MARRNEAILAAALVAVVTLFSAGSAEAAITDSLVGHYKFDETSAGPAVNSAGSPDATNNGAAIDQTGLIGRAYRFDGTDDYVDTATPTLIPATGDFTALMWINTTNPHSTQQGHLLGNNKGQAGRSNLMVQNSTLQFFLKDFGEFDSGTDVVDDMWHHVGVTRSSNTFSFIIDGSIDAAFGTSSVSIATDTNWHLGRRANGNDFQYDGLIDDVGIWDRALSAAEVSSVYQAGLSGDDLSKATTTPPAGTSVLVSSTGDDEVRRYDTASTVWSDDGAFASGTYAGVPLDAPYGLAQDGTGNVYVGEQKDGGRILRFDADGNYIDTVATGGADFTGQPEALTIGPHGDLYMSVAFGSDSDRIYKIDLSSDTVSTFIPSSVGGYSIENPRGIAFASDGNLYVTSRNTNAILKFDGTTGVCLGNLATPGYPQGLFWDGDNSVLLAAVDGGGGINSADRINSYTLTGTSTLAFDDGTDPAFLDMQRIAGEVYATDYAGDRVVRLTSSSTITDAATGLNGPGHILALAWDSPQPSVIPEPVTMLAVGLSLTGLGGYIRKRSR